ncbi:MAG: hypothetical protein WC764_02150 [Candidatus Paceibacterota bacterium]|jgi:hypothetical protein
MKKIEELLGEVAEATAALKSFEATHAEVFKTLAALKLALSLKTAELKKSVSTYFRCSEEDCRRAFERASLEEVELPAHVLDHVETADEKAAGGRSSGQKLPTGWSHDSPSCGCGSEYGNIYCPDHHLTGYQGKCAMCAR